MPDYQKLGLKCGIEIHQQLDTNKLFCSCPSIIREDKPDLTVERKMRAVAGELGDVDPAALHEFLRNRTLVYEYYRDTTCLVELDEEPPHEVNEEALKIVTKIALLLNAKVIDELQVMRKTVIDGSNTSGFQRTILLATDGYVETTLGKVGIQMVCLEEDAARIIKTEGNRVTYRLDRLGIPLVEIATDPDIKSPGHAREVAEKIGSILRVCKVRRGLGTIRQDLNISIKDGERIEVKGVQQLNLISKIVENEVRRQVMLIEVRDELRKKVFSQGKDVIKENATVVSDIFENTKCKVLQKGLGKGGIVLGDKLRDCRGLLKDKLGPELAQYARASSKARGLFHSDELPAYGITQREVDSVSKKLKLGENDAFMLICETKEEALKARAAVLKRIRLLVESIAVPKETRRALDDGRTEYMRPLPGSARMYPETDEMPIKINWMELKKELPELPEDTLNNLMRIGLSKEIANQMIKSQKTELFLALAKRFSTIKASVIATLVVMTPREVKKRYDVDASLNERHYIGILENLKKGAITKEVIPEIVFELAKHPEKKIKYIIKEKGLALMTTEELEKIVDRIIQQGIGEESINSLLGKVMAKTSGRADPKVVRDILSKKIK